MIINLLQNIILYILYFIFIKTKKIIKDTKNKEIIGVIARYNEDLNWLDEYPFNQIQYIVYNKGPNNNFNKNNVIKVVNLKNIGRCDHTYLYHVVNNYNNLDDITIFLPGSVDMINKKFIAKEMIIKILKYNKGIILAQPFFSSLFKNKLYNFKHNNYVATYYKNKELNPESQVQKSKIRPFGKWYENKFKNFNIKYTAQFGILSFDKRDITQFSKEYYENFLFDVSEGSNPEAGHYIEKSWLTIFNPKHTIIISNNLKQYMSVNKNLFIIS